MHLLGLLILDKYDRLGVFSCLCPGPTDGAALVGD